MAVTTAKTAGKPAAKGVAKTAAKGAAKGKTVAASDQAPNTGPTPNAAPAAPKKGATAEAGKDAAPAASAPKRTDGLNKPMKASDALAAIVGEEAMPRTQVVAKVWEYIKAKNLQDPADKRTIVADEALRAVFGKEKATMFEMQRLITPHLSA